MTDIERLTKYCREEFLSDPDLSDLHHVGVMYTFHGDNDEYEVSAEVDLIERKYRYFVNGNLVHEMVAESAEEFSTWLETMSFDGEYSICVNYVPDSTEE